MPSFLVFSYPHHPELTCLPSYSYADVVQNAQSNQTLFSVSFRMLNLQAGDTLSIYINSTLQQQLTSADTASTFFSFQGTSDDFMIITFTSGSSVLNETGFGFAAYVQTGLLLFISVGGS